MRIHPAQKRRVHARGTFGRHRRDRDRGQSDAPRRSIGEAARRVTCESHLKQLGIALQNYEATVGAFPPSMTVSVLGVNGFGQTYLATPSAHVMLLTQLEMTNLYNSINFSTNFGTSLLGLEAGWPNSTAALRTVEVFLCPSDGLTTAMPLGPNNYRVNAGSCGYCDGPAVPLFPPGQTGGVHPQRNEGRRFYRRPFKHPRLLRKIGGRREQLHSKPGFDPRPGRTPSK